MIDGVKPYPRYKDSGIEWLGQVPERWEVTRLKRLARLNPSKSEAATALVQDPAVTFLPMERVSADGRIDAAVRRPMSELWGGLTYFRRSDVIVAKITPCFENGKGACLDDLPTDVGFGSTEFHVLRPGDAVLPQFLYRLTTISDFRRLGAEAMIGAAGQQRVPQSFVGDFQVGVPPLAEQRAIVRYLSHVDRRIGRYVRAKQKLIALLNEQKQAIIHQAVTRGLDPSVPLKPSGVEWLGDIPEHWQVRRLGQVAGVFNGATPSRMQAAYWENGTVPWLSSGRVNNHVVKTPSELVTARALAECSLSLVPRGSVIIGLVGQGRTRGMSAILDLNACINQNLAAIVPHQEIHGLYILHFLTAFYKLIREFGRGGNQEALNCEIVRSFRILLPPLHEQEAIVEVISTDTAMLQAAIDSAQREISLLHEYRTRLIADVVTGKLDVRAVSTSLPDEPNQSDEPEPLDDDTDIEGEEPDSDPEEA